MLVGECGRPRVPTSAWRGPTSTPTRTTEGARAPSSSTSVGGSPRSLEITRTGTVLGTPAYMARSSLAGRHADARSDQFSFAVALFEALYGERPFAGSSYTELAQAIAKGAPREVDPRKHRVPPAVHAALLRAMSREPGQRFADMKAVVAALRRAMVPAPRRLWGYGALATLGVAAVALGLAANAADDSSSAAGDDSPAAAAGPVDPWTEVVEATNSPPPVPTPLPEDPTGVTVHRLRNGLTVYLAHHPQAPFVSMQLVLRAGPAAEDDQTRGVSYLVAASVFRGTERLGTLDAERERPLLVTQHALLDVLPDIDDPVAKKRVVELAEAAHAASADLLLPNEWSLLGAELGVKELTAVDGSGMMISAEVPRHRLESWVELAAEAVRRPVFRGFVSTAAGTLSWLQWFSHDGLGYSLARNETAGRGSAELEFQQAATNVGEVPYREARAFHERLYRPNNMAVVLVGDVTATDAIPMIERYFGDWAPAPVPPPRALGTVEPSAPRVVHAIEDQGPTGLTLVWLVRRGSPRRWSSRP